MGAKPTKKVHIKINGVEAVASEDVRWSSPKGAEPRVYEFSHVFEDFLSTGQDIELHFLFQCGLTRGLPGGKEDREPDFGVDVYGNGRLIEPFLRSRSVSVPRHGADGPGGEVHPRPVVHQRP